MEYFNLQSPYFHLVVLFSCFDLFKIPSQFMRAFPISSLMIPFNLIKYTETVGILNNRCLEVV